MKNNVSKIMLIMSALVVVLLISACKNTERSPFLPPPDPIPPPEMRWDVQTDFNILTPFVPSHSLHSRLHDGAMPELIPSNNYGLLLPYSSATVMDDGGLRSANYGLVTIDGVVVTDLIYDSIVRAEYSHSWYYGAATEVFPAYSLSKTGKVADIKAVDENDDVIIISYDGTIIRMAACALDGSWITPFDYYFIKFTEEVIILVRDESTPDIDVIDYNGKHLYNMLDLDWIRDISKDYWSSSSFTNMVSGGYGSVQLKNGTYAFIDALTGSAYYTEYIGVSLFSEGFAPVAVRGGDERTNYMIWGLINTDFEIVIPPKYAWAPVFYKGKAVVELPDNSSQVINTRGEVLFNVPDGYRLDHSYEGPNFIMYSEFGAKYLTSDFKEFTPPDESISADYFYPRYLNNGWYTTGNEVGSHLMREDEVHYFPGIQHIDFFDGEIIVYGERYADSHGFLYKNGVMTLDGKEIIPSESGVYISTVTKNDTLKAFIVSTGSSLFITSQQYSPNTYRLVDINGNTIIQGRGILTYHEILELYSVQRANSFSWLDIEANPIITIPFLSSTFD